jgi:hypothetical protein
MNHTQSASAATLPMPFTILVDSQEKGPFRFDNIRARSFVDARQRIYTPSVEWKYLGVGMGDYSIAGFEGRIAIERKALEDAHGTLLGWKQRRDRFKRELANLADMETAAVVVEASLDDVLAQAPEWGKKTAAENRLALLGTILAWQQEYRVPWHFCGSKELATIVAFRIMERFWYTHRRDAVSLPAFDSVQPQLKEVG